MSTDGTGWRDSGDEPTDGEFRAIVERYQNAENQCTIFPADADESERTTTWITAKSPSFVDLREYR